MENAKLHKKIEDLQEQVNEIDNRLTRLIEQASKHRSEVESRMYNYKEAAAYLGLEVDGLRGLVHKRQITYYKPNGKNVFFEPRDLDAWLERNRLDAAWERDEPKHIGRVELIIDDESEKELSLNNLPDFVEIIREEKKGPTSEERTEHYDNFVLSIVEECRKK